MDIARRQPAQETAMGAEAATQRRAREVLTRLRKAYPDARCELRFTSPLELAIAAILSAQCTDERVNSLTPALFAKYRTAADWSSLPLHVLEQDIHSTGFYRKKAKSIHALCETLEAKYAGRLPDNLDELVQLPGIGRKTANLIISAAFGQPGIIVDTHFKRLSHRLRFTSNANPDKIEADLKDLIPEKDWSSWSNCMVFHGRYCCHARKPRCGECPIEKLCPHVGQPLSCTP